MVRSLENSIVAINKMMALVSEWYGTIAGTGNVRFFVV